MVEESDDLRIARARIAEEAERRTGSLDLSGLGLSSLPVELAALMHLESSDLSRCIEISDLAPLAGLTALQSLDCSNTQVTDLGPLAGLTALQSLVCSNTQVTDLGPLAGLTALQSLDCSYTQVTDLGPLAGLTALQSLACSRHAGDGPRPAGGPHRAAEPRLLARR